MSGLKMPGKGKAALLLSELNAEHAPRPDEPAGNEVNQTVNSHEETNVTTLQETNESSKQDLKQATNTGTLERSGPHNTPTRDANSPQRRSEPSTQNGKAAKQPNDREERLARALQMAAEDEITVVTVRVSARLNEYMDRYVERLNRISPKRRYRKQDAIAEAFAAFFADHPLPPAPAEEDL
jgi:hypothetical protein